MLRILYAKTISVKKGLAHLYPKALELEKGLAHLYPKALELEKGLAQLDPKALESEKDNTPTCETTGCPKKSPKNGARWLWMKLKHGKLWTLDPDGFT